ncbi:MAG: RtcB family protein [Tepidisphaeraceae bacterium]
MTGKQLLKLGFKPGRAIGVAIRLIPAARKAFTRSALEGHLQAILSDPGHFIDDVHFGELAKALLEKDEHPARFVERDRPAPYQIWGHDLEPEALKQMSNAARLPVAVSGALMPDAHVGYGLPIGGVLATQNAVIPYAVGVDIACRMKLSVFDIPAHDLKRLNETLVRALHREPKFGTGASFSPALEHDVLDEDWSITPITQRIFDKARAQLGTSGSGNHFVEFGILTIPPSPAAPGDGAAPSPSPGIPGEGRGEGSFDLPPGQYLALLSHSGSRGAGAQTAEFYSRLARELHPELPPDLKFLAWLDLDTDAGQEYWAAMNLMGKYAHANHELIHRRVARAIGAQVIAGVENHHNFAWKESHAGRELIVHRKGATPAGAGVLGVIPGSMATPGFVVRGRGVADSLESASHGAGRRMSRTAAREKFRWAHIRPMLAERGVQLLSAGIDENPLAYKDIHAVMDQQKDLVEVIAQFDPKIVKMAEAGERPED